MDTILGKVKTPKAKECIKSDTLREQFNHRLLAKMQGLILSRQRSCKTTNDMAELCGVSRASIVRYENYKPDAYLTFCYTKLLSHEQA